MFKFIEEYGAYGIFGALSILGFLQQAVTFDDSIKIVIDTWVSLTRPIGSFVLSPIAEYFSVDLPTFVIDYFIVSCVFSAGIIRAVKSDSWIGLITTYVFGVILWPIVISVMCFSFLKRKMQLDKLKAADPTTFKEMIEAQNEDYEERASGLRKVFSAFVWTAIVLTLNHIIIGGAA